MQLLILILAIVNSCSNDVLLKKSEINYLGDFANQMSDSNLITTDSIIGEWTIYSVKTRSTDSVKTHNTVSVKTRNTESTCYVCPQINFSNNGMGRIKLPLGEEEMFNWKINNDTISIFYTLDAKYRTISHNQYIMKFDKKQAFEELELRCTTRDYSYILRR